MEDEFVCRKHRVRVGDVEHLPAEGAAVYGHCVECAIASRMKVEQPNDRFPTLFTLKEVAQLMGLNSMEHVRQIEEKALDKFKKNWIKMLPKDKDVLGEEYGCSDNEMVVEWLEEREDYIANDS